jgi:hypothetical protein
MLVNLLQAFFQMFDGHNAACFFFLISIFKFMSDVKHIETLIKEQDMEHIIFNYILCRIRKEVFDI